jgi:hypothetical protein
MAKSRNVTIISYWESFECRLRSGLRVRLC